MDGLGRWLDWTDAIPLAAALHAGTPEAPAASSDVSSSRAAAEVELARVRAALVRSMTEDRPATPARQGPNRTARADAGLVETGVDFLPYRQRYIAHQRAMEAGIEPLRLRVRTDLAALSSDMRRLAAVDAVMDKVLGARERSLLATMPSWLEKRFEHLRRAHEESRAVSGAAFDAGGSPQPGDWLDEFRKDMQRMLIAELDLRLQPVQGLVDALRMEREGPHG